MCPGWQPRPYNEEGSLAPSPLTVVFGGNGAGKSALFDGVFFVVSGQVCNCAAFVPCEGLSSLYRRSSVIQQLGWLSSWNP